MLLGLSTPVARHYSVFCLLALCAEDMPRIKGMPWFVSNYVLGFCCMRYGLQSSAVLVHIVFTQYLTHPPHEPNDPSQCLIGPSAPSVKALAHVVLPMPTGPTGQ